MPMVADRATVADRAIDWEWNILERESTRKKFLDKLRVLCHNVLLQLKCNTDNAFKDIG